MPTGKAARELQIYDPVLTGVARQLVPGGFIYDEVAPHVPVTTVSAQYPVFDERYFFQQVENKLADRAETPEVDLVWSTETFLCEDYGLKTSITPRERAQAKAIGDAIRLETSKVRQVHSLNALAREKRLATLLKKTSNGGALTHGAAATAAFASSTAIEADWKTAKMAVYNSTGLVPNVAIVPYAKAYDMATNPTLRELFKYTVNETAFIELGDGADGEKLVLPKVFHGTRIVIPLGTLAHTGNPEATKSFSDIWGTSIRFLYVAPGQDLKNADWGTPGTVYSFWHPPLTVEGDGASGPVVDRWTEKDPVVEYIREVECVDEKVVAPDTGYELTGA